MTPEKLDALRRLAEDPRTPEEEARTAAIQYVRHGGKLATPRRTNEGPPVRGRHAHAHQDAVDMMGQLVVAQAKVVDLTLRCQALKADRDYWRAQSHRSKDSSPTSPNPAKPSKQSDITTLKALLQFATLTTTERKAFADMLAQLIGIPSARLSKRQRAWADRVARDTGVLDQPV